MQRKAPPVLLALALVGFPSAGGSVAPSDLPSPYGETTFEVVGSAYGRFSLANPATLTSISISTEDRTAVFIVSGPSRTWLLRSADDTAGFFPENPLPMVPGDYVFYLATGPGRRASATTVLDGLADHGTIVLTEHIAYSFSEMRGGPLVSDQAARFHGAQSFDGEAFSGFFVRTEGMGPFHDVREARWSNADGILRCDGSLAGLVDLGPWSRVSAHFADRGHRLPVNLTYFRQGAGVILTESVQGIWVQRAPGDVAASSFQGVRPPGWSFIESNPILDQDAYCTQHSVGLISGSFNIN